MCLLAGNKVARTAPGLDMSGFFWVASITMAIVAFAFMVEGLAIRLEENPEDGASWLLLAKSYKHLGQIPDAIAAYAKAAALGKTDPDLAALSGIQTPINQ